MQSAAQMAALEYQRQWEQQSLYRKLGEDSLKRLTGMYSANLGTARKPQCNCRNCGAPPEPICSYCGTEA